MNMVPMYVQLAGAWMQHLCEEISSLRLGTLMKKVTDTILLFWVNLPMPSRKCSIKELAKCKTFIYVFPEICFQEVNDSALNF